MRAVDFDPDAWLAEAQHAGSAIPAKVAIPHAPAFPEKIAEIAGIAARPLPEDVAKGLVKRRLMLPPRITNPVVWPEIVADAVRIADEGWAAQALGLGWEPLHLFGVEPSTDPDTWDYSLAAMLAGQSIRAVDEQRFYLRDGEVRCFFEKRPRPALSKFLWELGN